MPGGFLALFLVLLLRGRVLQNSGLSLRHVNHLDLIIRVSMLCVSVNLLLGRRWGESDLLIGAGVNGCSL